MLNPFGNREDRFSRNPAQITCHSIALFVSNLLVIQDLFHVYLNKCEFQFLRLHIDKTNTFCFLIDNGRVTGTTK